MGDGGGESIGSVVWFWGGFEMKVEFDHFLHLFFIGIAIAGHSFFDFIRSVFKSGKIMLLTKGILDKNYKVRGIFVEGAYGKIDTGWLCEIKDKSLREAVAGRMMEDGMLNASEYYTATNDKKDFLFGLEDKSVHEKNIKRLGYILGRQNIYSEILAKIRKNMEYWDAKYTNIRNKRFNKTLDKYRRQEISTERFYVILCKYMKKINENPQDYNNVLPVKLSDYPNMENYLLVSKLNSEIDMKKVQIQLQALLA